MDGDRPVLHEEKPADAGFSVVATLVDGELRVQSFVGRGLVASYVRAAWTPEALTATMRRAFGSLGIKAS